MEDAVDTALNKLLALEVSKLEVFKPKTVAEQVALRMVEAANGGDMRALQMIADRTGGRASQRESGASTAAADAAALFEKVFS